MSKKVQLNLRVSPDIAERLRADARRSYRTLEGIGAVIIEDFFKAWSLKERLTFYQTKQPRRVGRTIRNLQEKMGVKVE